MRTCTYCQKPNYARGLCSTHAKRDRLGQDLEAPIRHYRKSAHWWEKVEGEKVDGSEAS